jgi:hypothetical protein
MLGGNAHLAMNDTSQAFAGVQRSAVGRRDRSGGTLAGFDFDGTNA